MQNQDDRSFTEEIQVRGGELVDKVKALIQDGNVRRLVVRRRTGEALVEIPLTAGIGIAGLLTLMAPVLAALGAMAALIADFRVQIERAPPNADHDIADLSKTIDSSDVDGEGGYVARNDDGEEPGRR